MFSAAVHSAVLLYPAAKQPGEHNRQIPVSLTYATEHREANSQQHQASRNTALPLVPTREPPKVVTKSPRTDQLRHNEIHRQQPVEPAAVAVDTRQASSAPTIHQAVNRQSLALMPLFHDEEYGDDAIETAETMLPKAAQAISEKPITPVAYVKASYEHTPAPAYPEEARRSGREGRVTVSVLVSAHGQPKEVALSNSSGSASLDRAALAAVRQWKFKPARRNSDAIESWVKVPVEFRLADANAW